MDLCHRTKGRGQLRTEAGFVVSWVCGLVFVCCVRVTGLHFRKEFKVALRVRGSSSFPERPLGQGFPYADQGLLGVDLVFDVFGWGCAVVVLDFWRTLSGIDLGCQK